MTRFLTIWYYLKITSFLLAFSNLLCVMISTIKWLASSKIKVLRRNSKSFFSPLNLINSFTVKKEKASTFANRTNVPHKRTQSTTTDISQAVSQLAHTESDLLDWCLVILQICPLKILRVLTSTYLFILDEFALNSPSWIGTCHVEYCYFWNWRQFWNTFYL